MITEIQQLFTSKTVKGSETIAPFLLDIKCSDRKVCQKRNESHIASYRSCIIITTCRI